MELEALARQNGGEAAGAAGPGQTTSETPAKGSGGAVGAVDAPRVRRCKVCLGTVPAPRRRYCCDAHAETGKLRLQAWRRQHTRR